MTSTKKPGDAVAFTIRPPNMQERVIRIVGTSPYMQHRFSKKAEMMATMQQGAKAKNKKQREPRDFERDFQEARHMSADGWDGVPASAFRNALISACRLVGFQMTKAKLSVFVLADGSCAKDGTPLVRLHAGEPRMSTMPVRNDSGVADVRARPMWTEWSADVRVRWDADQFAEADVVNLMARVGLQVGIGEGRPDSKDSAGLGYGLFDVKAVA